MHVIKFCLLLLTRHISSVSEIRLLDFITIHEKIVLLIKPYNLIMNEYLKIKVERFRTGDKMPKLTIKISIR